jgi:hypothetical protein
MLSGAWCLYEKRSQRWLFCRRKRVINPASVTMLAMAALSLTAWLRFAA